MMGPRSSHSTPYIGHSSAASPASPRQNQWPGLLVPSALLSLVLVACALAGPAATPAAATPGAPAFPFPTLELLFPRTPVATPLGAAPMWFIMFLACGVALLLVGGIIFLAQFFMPSGLTVWQMARSLGFQSFLVVLIYPAVEELVIRLGLFMWFFHGILGANLMAAFWWAFVCFLIGHLFALIHDMDFGRILDACNLGVVNTVMFAHIVLLGGFPILPSILVFIIIHVVYNAIVVFLLRPLFPTLLLVFRLFGAFVALACYWFGMNELSTVWHW
jgi:hypothetical protein